jgi:probable FeS assembly SUF system protein SufT
MTTPLSDTVTLTRDCEAVQIPSGTVTSLPQGTEVMITQTLGGSYTVTRPDGSLYTIAGKDADALGRKPSVAAQSAASPADANATVKEEQVWEQLRTCFDPEIPISIVDMGLVYDVKVLPLAGGGNRVEVKMTLTMPGCGMGRYIAADAQSKILTIPGVKEADVQLVWDPPWNRDMISPEIRKKFGMS